MLENLTKCFVIRNKKTNKIELSATVSNMNQKITKTNFYLPNIPHSNPNKIHWLSPRFCMKLTPEQELKYKIGYLLLFDFLRNFLSGTGEDEKRFLKELTNYKNKVVTDIHDNFVVEEWTTDFQGKFIKK